MGEETVFREDKKKSHRDRNSGRKADKKKSKKDAQNPVQELSDKQRNPKAFAFNSAIRAERKFRRKQDIDTKKQHIPLVDRSPVEPPPILIAVVGPPKVGKTTLINNLIRLFTKCPLTDIKGPVTIVTGKKRRITLIECNNDINSMIDLAKVADLVLLLCDASFGFEMEIFEFLNICQVHGMPRIMGILTHLDMIKNSKTLKSTKKTLKHRFWAEIYSGAKLFYLSGILHGEYLRNEIKNLGRFISVMKFRPLTWRTTHSYMIGDRLEDLTSQEEIRKNPKCDRNVSLYGYIRGVPLNKSTSVHIAGFGDIRIEDVSHLPDPCPLPEEIKKRALIEKERLIYAPFSGVGGIVYDKDAVYVELGGSHSHTKQRDNTEEENIVTNLIDAKETLDFKMEHSEMQLFTGGKKLTAKDFEDEDEDDGEQDEDEQESDEDEDEESDEDDEAKTMETKSSEKDCDDFEEELKKLRKKNFNELKEEKIEDDGRVRRKVIFNQSDDSSEDEIDSDSGNEDESEEIEDDNSEFVINKLERVTSDEENNCEESPKKKIKSKKNESQSTSEEEDIKINSSKKKNDSDSSSSEEEIKAKPGKKEKTKVKIDSDSVEEKIKSALSKIRASVFQEEAFEDSSDEEEEVKVKKSVCKVSLGTKSKVDSDEESEDEDIEGKEESSADEIDGEDEINLSSKPKVDSSEDENIEAGGSSADVDGEDEEDETDEEHENRKSNDSESDDENMKWKENLVKKAEETYAERQKSSQNLMKLVYGVFGNEYLKPENENNEEDEDEEIGGLFKVASKEQQRLKAQKDQMDLIESSLFMPWNANIKNWLDPENKILVQNCFVTGKWKESEDASELLKLDDAGFSDDSDVFGDFEDLETGEKFTGENEDTNQPQKRKMEDEADREALAEKKRKLKEKFDSEYDTSEKTSYYDDLKMSAEKQAQLNKSVFENMPDELRVKIEGYRPGMYVRMEFLNVPYEFVANFDPRYPLVIGALNMGEENIGFVNVKIKKHRWYKKILKTNDPLIISLGWRRFQTIPIYSKLEDDMKCRYLKYTPEHLTCKAHFWGPITPQGTGFLALQRCEENPELLKQQGFRIAATGAVQELDKSTQIMKKLKLIGYPMKVLKKTAFIKGMFNSTLEVAKFEGAGIKTVSGIRGQIKKAVSKPEGVFRAAFEDKIQMSDIVFCRTWYKVDVKKFYTPVNTLLLPLNEKNAWRGLRTTGDIKRDKGIRNQPAKDSLYTEIVRQPKVFKPLVIPNKLQKSLPYRDKPRHGVKHDEKKKPVQRVAVVREPHEQKVAKMLKMIKTSYDHKQEQLKEQTKQRLEKHRVMIEEQEARKGKKLRDIKKAVFRGRSKAAIIAEKKGKGSKRE